jgi:NADH:ubiquinone oxidoreductase subunit F (NADH-binding)
VTLVERVLPRRPFESLRAYLDAGGGQGIESARSVEPDAVTAEVEASGLRGRGGGGFPTATKWRTVSGNLSPDLPTSVVVNGAEGEPGTFKDRAILRANPYAVIEGALVAAHAVTGSDVVVALKASGTVERARVEAAIAEMRDAGVLGDVTVTVATGPDEYLFGEETALLEVVDGRAPFPRIAPPYRRGVVELVEHDDDVDTGSGLAAHVEMASPGQETGAPPALIGNVETMANVPAIIQKGADWFRAHGTAQSPGTIVCTVTGDVAHPAVGEIALGTTVRAAIDEVGGGLLRSRVVRAVLCGVSAGPLPPELLDTRLTYEDMAQAGSGLGTASLIVVCEGTDMTAVAAGAARFLAVESCGQCTPCKRDGLVLAEALERLCAGQGKEDDLDTITSALQTIADGARCNLASQQQAVIGRILHRWPDEPAAHAVAGAPGGSVEPLLVSEIVELADGEVTLDIRRRTKQPDWTHGEEWSGSYPADLLGDHHQHRQLD